MAPWCSMIDEIVGTVDFSVTAGPLAAPQTLTVCLNVAETGGNRVIPANEGAKTVTISSGSTTTPHTVSWTDDTNADDRDSTITVTALSPSATCSQTGYQAHASNHRDQALVVDDEATVVTLARDGTGDVIEGAPIDFTVTLGRALFTGEVIEILLPISGMNVTPADWSLTTEPGTTNTGVTLTHTNTASPRVGFNGAGAQTAHLRLTPAIDNTAEGDETYTITVGADTTGTNVGGGSTPHSTPASRMFSVTVTDQTLPVISILHTNYNSNTDQNPPQTEGATGSFTLTATPRFNTAQTVNLTITDAPNADYVPSGNQGARTVQFSSSGAGAATQTYSFGIPTDNIDEPNGRVTATLVAGTGYTIDATESSHFFEALDNDATPVTLARSGGTSAIGENGGTATLTVTLGRRLRSTETVTAPLTVTGSGIVAGDYTLALATGSSLNSGVTLNTASPHSTATPAVVFNGHDTNTVQTATLTLTAVEDTTDEGASETLTVGFGSGNRAVMSNLDRTSGTGAGGTTPTGTVEVVITDNDTPVVVPVITIAPFPNTSVTEGAPASFRLTATPATTDVVAINLTIADAANADFVDSVFEGSQSININGSSAVYTLLTENGNSDTDEPSGPVTITIAADTANPAKYTVGSPSAASVTVNDNDATTVTLTTPDISATEDSSTATAQIRLNLGRALRAGESLAVPLQFSGGTVGTDFTLALTAATGVSLNATTGVVTFTGPTGSPLVATVTLTALSDDDADHDPITVSIPATSIGTAPILTATGLGVNTNTAPAATGSRTGAGVITVTDDDTRGLTLTSPAVTEGGSGTYTVVLDTKPSAAVTVTIASNNTDVTIDDTDSGTNGTQNTLTFTTSNWNQPQTVTIRAAEDNDTANNVVTLTHEVSGGGYGSTQDEDLEITITDNDSPGLVLPATLTVNEGADGNYTVALATQPTSAVTVTVAVPANTDVTIDGPDAGATFSASEVLNFTTSNWNETQTVTVRAASDDDPTDDPVTLAHTALGGGYNSVTGNVAVTITDDDEVGLTFSRTSLTVAEGASNTYTVVLDTQPSAAVTVTIQGHANTDLTLNPTSLTFNRTGTNLWSTAQTVTVTAAQDTDTANDAATLAHTAAGGDYGSITGNVAVTVTDDDTPTPVTPPIQPTPPPVAPQDPQEPAQPEQEPEPEPEPQPVIPILSIQANTDSVTEGAPASFTVTADPAPVEPITVSLTLTAQGDFTSADATGTQTLTLRRATTSFMTATLNDFIDEADGSITLTLQAADGYSLSPNPSATVEIHDDDTAGIEWSTTGIRIDQIGETGQYTVQLTSQPTAPVTVTPITQPDSGIVTPSPSSLTFTKDNWNTPQTFTLTAQQEGAVTLTHVITSQDPHYAAMQSRQAPLRVVVGEDLTTVAIPWQTRFARTQAGHVLDSISHRIQSTPTPGLSARLAGYRMDTTPKEMQSRWMQNPYSFPKASRAITLSELLSDSSMSWSATATDGSIASLWAQGALSEFDAKSGETTLNGEVLTTLLGMDQTHTHGQRGLVLSYSQAEGQYQTKNHGQIESEQTLLTPWMSRQVNDRMTLWGALGYGTGDLTLIRSEREDLTTDTHTAFVALGSDAILREEAHRTLSIITDALWLRTRTEAVTDGLELNHATAHASRMRVGIKGSGRIPAIPGLPRFTAAQALKMNWESALRHDGGDAESGFGVEVGGGVQWTDSRRGLNLQINGRSLITHHDSDIKDRGLSLSMGFNPSPAEQGFTFTLKQDWGTVSSGRERLLTAESLEPAQSATGQRFKAQAGVGFTIGDGRYTAHPHLGVGLYAKERETTLGWRLQSVIGRSERTLGLKLTRHENDGQSEHRMKVEAGVRW